ncbi:MAG: hypothetical protein AAFZ17_01095 [Cyanobacteria bacterium J06650_10]
MSSSSSHREWKDDESRRRDSLDKISDRLLEVAKRVKYEENDGAVGRLIRYSGRNSVEIIFPTVIGNISICEVIDNLNELIQILKKITYEKEESGNARHIEEARTRLEDFLMNIQSTKKTASSAETTSKNPRLASISQEHLCDLAGQLVQTCDEINELRAYRSTIANWTKLVKEVSKK